MAPPKERPRPLYAVLRRLISPRRPLLRPPSPKTPIATRPAAEFLNAVASLGVGTLVVSVKDLSAARRLFSAIRLGLLRPLFGPLLTAFAGPTQNISPLTAGLTAPLRLLAARLLVSPKSVDISATRMRLVATDSAHSPKEVRRRQEPAISVARLGVIRTFKAVLLHAETVAATVRLVPPSPFYADATGESHRPARPETLSRHRPRLVVSDTLLQPASLSIIIPFWKVGLVWPVRAGHTFVGLVGEEPPPISAVTTPPLDMGLVVEAVSLTPPFMAIRRLISLPTKKTIRTTWVTNTGSPAATIAPAWFFCRRQQLQRLIAPFSAVLDRPLAIGTALSLVVMTRRLPSLVVTKTVLAAASLVARRKGSSYQRPA